MVPIINAHKGAVTSALGILLILVITMIVALLMWILFTGQSDFFNYVANEINKFVTIRLP